MESKENDFLGPIQNSFNVIRPRTRTASDFIMTSLRNDLGPRSAPLPGGTFMSLVTERGRNSFIRLWPSSERRALTGLSNLCDPEGLHGASRAQQSPAEPRTTLEMDDKEGKSKRMTKGRKRHEQQRREGTRRREERSLTGREDKDVPMGPEGLLPQFRRMFSGSLGLAGAAFMGTQAAQPENHCPLTTTLLGSAHGSGSQDLGTVRDGKDPREHSGFSVGAF